MTEQQGQQEQTEQEGSAYWVSTKSGIRVPVNFVFAHKGIAHVGNILTHPGGPDQLAEQVFEKYRRIAAGLDPVTGEPKVVQPVTPARKLIAERNVDLGPRDQDLARSGTRAAAESEIERLRAEIAQLKAGEPDAETARLLTEQAELEKELAALQSADSNGGAYLPKNGAEPKAAPRRPNRKPN